MTLFYSNNTHTHTDDDNIITLKPLAQFSDCQNEFINASYIHVRTYTITYQHYHYMYIQQGYSKAMKFIATQGVYKSLNHY